MNETLDIPWGMVFSNFIWILGVAIILADFSYHEFLAHLKKIKRTEVFRRKSFKKPFFLGLILITVGICSSFILHIFPSKPEAIILKDMVKFPPSSFEGRKKIKGDTIFMLSNGIIKSKRIHIEKSKYEIRIISRGSEALGETSRLKVYVGINLIADYYTSTKYKERIIEYDSKAKKIARLILEFVNDYYSPKRKLDRNVWIKSISIAQVDNISN